MKSFTIFSTLLISILTLGCKPVFPEQIRIRALPEFTHKSESEWINSGPLTVASLKGKVILIDVWTFACWNCYRSFPWLNQVEKKFSGKALQVVGIHSPEFDREKIPTNVRAKVNEFGLKHPVMIDTDFSYWNALENQFWPAFYLVDKKGKIRYFFAGETHAGEEQALEIESRIDQLLKE